LALRFDHLGVVAPDLQTGRAHFRDPNFFPLGEPEPAIACGGDRALFPLSPMGFNVELRDLLDHMHVELLG